MARPRKRFTQKELEWAAEYIDRKFKLDDSWPGLSKKARRQAEKEFRLAVGQGPWLEDWCSRWLDEAALQRLLGAIRARRKRARQDRAGILKKNLTLDERAWRCLKGLAARDKVTISQFIIDRLEKEYMEFIGSKEE